MWRSVQQEGRKITFGFDQLLLSTCLNAAQEACRAAAVATTTQRENNGEKNTVQAEQDEGCSQSSGRQDLAPQTNVMIM